MRTKKSFTNFELVCEWCHRRDAGNSGIFVWTTDDSIQRLTKAGKGGLPHGIVVSAIHHDHFRAVGFNRADAGLRGEFVDVDHGFAAERARGPGYTLTMIAVRRGAEGQVTELRAYRV